MAAYGWRKDRSVALGLFAEGHRFSFLQAVKLLETLHPEKDAVGEGAETSDEVARFRSAVRLDFAPTEVEAVRLPERPGEPVEMTVNFLGLAGGASGPLPAALVERIMGRVFQRDTALRDFLDVFNHRLVSMLYRARKKYRPSLTRRPPHEGPVARTLFAFTGLGTPGLRGRMGVRDRALLLYAGLLTGTPRSMVGLERMLAHYFAVPVEVLPFRGGWIWLETDQLTRIGPSGQNRVLGESAVLGRRVWMEQYAFELRIGPVGFERFRDFLPIGEAAGALAALVRYYAGDELAFRARLVLAAAEVPELRLGRADGPRLGWSTWLRTREPASDDEQVVLADRKLGGSWAPLG